MYIHDVTKNITTGLNELLNSKYILSFVSQKDYKLHYPLDFFKYILLNLIHEFNVVITTILDIIADALSTLFRLMSVIPYAGIIFRGLSVIISVIAAPAIFLLGVWMYWTMFKFVSYPYVTLLGGMLSLKLLFVLLVLLTPYILLVLYLFWDVVKIFIGKILRFTYGSFKSYIWLLGLILFILFIASLLVSVFTVLYSEVPDLFAEEESSPRCVPTSAGSADPDTEPIEPQDAETCAPITHEDLCSDISGCEWDNS